MFKIWLILISYEIHTSSKFTSTELEFYQKFAASCLNPKRLRKNLKIGLMLSSQKIGSGLVSF